MRQEWHRSNGFLRALLLTVVAKWSSRLVSNCTRARTDGQPMRKKREVQGKVSESGNYLVFISFPKERTQFNRVLTASQTNDYNDACQKSGASIEEK